MIRSLLGGIVLYGIIIYIVVEFGPLFDIHVISFNPDNILKDTPFFLLVGGIFWFVYGVVRKILHFIAIPFNRISFGLINVFVNVGMIYLFVYLINESGIGIQASTGSMLEVIIGSFVLGLASLFIKYM